MSRASVSTVLLASLAGRALAGPVTLLPIALSGDDVPGLIGARFAGFSDVRLNDSGDVAFWAELEGGVTPENDGVIVRVRTGEQSVLLMEGQDAPWHLLPARFAGVPGAMLGDDGSVAFIGSVTNLGIVDPIDEARNIGVFRLDDGVGVSSLLRKGDQAPGLDAGVLVRNPGDLAFSRSGSVGVRISTWNELADPGPMALYSDRSGSLDLLARGGTTVEHNNEILTLDHLDSPATDSVGGLVFRAALDDDRFPQRNYAIVRDAMNGIEVVVATGDDAPGLPGAVFESLGIRPAMNASGDVVFLSTLSRDGVEGEQALWRSSNGQIDLVARQGDVARGTGGGVFSKLDAEPQINEDGQIAFWARVDEAGDSISGIWLAGENGAFAVAIEGDGVFLLDGVRLAQVEKPTLDDRGRVTFAARLEGAGVTPESDRAIFALDEVGRVEMLLREGDTIDVRGDSRVVREITFEGSVGGSRQAALLLRLDDDSQGVFVMNVAAPADLDGDGDTDADDFFRYFELFAGGDPEADFDQDGDRDADDFVRFFDVFRIL